VATPHFDIPQKIFLRLNASIKSTKLPPSRGDQYLQKDDRKPIVFVISDQKTPNEKMGFAKISYFFLRLPWRAGLSRRSGGEDGSLVRRRLTSLAAAFHATRK
jgi:hypothetical protein